MVQEFIDDKKERFHIVRLAEFNAMVLTSVQNDADTNQSGACRQILVECARQNGHELDNIPDTKNQSLFFAMAYLSLVWLRASLEDDEVKRALSSPKMKGVWDCVKTGGPRDVSSEWQKLRLIRNALSHGKVSIDDEFVFCFWDQNIRCERSATFLKIVSYGLGNLSNKFYYAVSDVIYS